MQACAKEGPIHKFTTGDSTQLCDLSTMVPGFKSLKTYSLGTHAASPKFAAGTNHGVAVLSVGDSRRANVAVAASVRELRQRWCCMGEWLRWRKATNEDFAL